MDMNFLNKKILLRIVIIVVFIIAIVIGAFFYWQRTHIPPDISLEAIKEKCLEDVSKMNDQELINEVKTLEFSDEISVSVIEERINYAYRNMINYLICRVDNSKNEEDYNLAKNFIEELGIQEENKQNSLVWLDEAYSQESNSLRVINAFTIQLALGDLAKLCPDELPNLCSEEAIHFDVKETKLIIGNCNNVCNLIDQYSEDRDKIERDIVNFRDWHNDSVIYEKQYELRVAIAYRFGGQDLALKICENVIDSEKENCVSKVNWVSSFNCDGLRENIENLICQYDLK